MSQEKARRPRREAEPFVDVITAWAQEEGITNWTIGGSWRREAPTIADLDVMVITDDGTFGDIEMPVNFVAERKGPNIIQGELNITRDIIPEFPIDDSMHVDFWTCKPEERGAFLCFVTGPKALNIMQRRRAQDRGWTLSQYGLFDGEGKRLDNGVEVGVYGALGMPYLGPALRQQYADKPPAPELKPHSVQVQSHSDPTVYYTVTVRGSFWSCTCPAFKYSAKIPATCKHIAEVKPALEEELRARGVELPTDEG